PAFCAVAEEARHDPRIDLGDEWVAGDERGDFVVGPDPDATARVELALQPPDHGTREGHINFQDLWIAIRSADFTGVWGRDIENVAGPSTESGGRAMGHVQGKRARRFSVL